MKFAKVVFWIAAIWGVLILTPLYFMFDVIGAAGSSADHASRFLLRLRRVGLAWQVALLFIARDPVRLRPMMIPAVLEKFGYGAFLARPVPASSGFTRRT